MNIILDPAYYKEDKTHLLVTSTDIISSFNMNYDICKFILKILNDYNCNTYLTTDGSTNYLLTDRLKFQNTISYPMSISIYTSNLFEGINLYYNKNQNLTLQNTIINNLSKNKNILNIYDSCTKKICNTIYNSIIIEIGCKFFSDNNIEIKYFGNIISNSIISSFNLKKKEKNMWYYVRKNNNKDTQLIKTSNIKNAINIANQHIGYDVYDKNGKVCFKSTYTKTNTVMPSNPRIIILQNNGLGYSSPDYNSTIISTLLKGTEIKLISKYNNFWKILYNNKYMYIDNTIIIN